MNSSDRINKIFKDVNVLELEDYGNICLNIGMCYAHATFKYMIKENFTQTEIKDIMDKYLISLDDNFKLLYFDFLNECTKDNLIKDAK